jgi:transposase
MTSEKDVQKLKDKIKELEGALEKERNEKEKLKKEFEEFKAKHDITVSKLKQALKIKPNLSSIAKPLGAQKGHKAFVRRIPERVDKIKELIPKRCPHCNNPLPKQSREIRSRHVTDIKLISKVITTRYDIHRKYCPKCKKIVEPEVKAALPSARFGICLMLLVMYLRLGLRLPCKKVCEFFRDMYNLHISEGEIINILRQLAIAFGDYYVYLEKIVKLAKVKYSDTTSWRIKGRNYVAWVFIACGVVLYKIRKSNNHKAGLSFLNKQRGNVLVVDRLSAMRLFAKKAGFILQLCWSHILQDSKELAKAFGTEGLYVHKRLKEIYVIATGLNHKGNYQMVEQLKAEIFQLTLRHYKRSTIRKFVDNLYYRDGEDLFRFVTNPDIDSTNNLSERELRALVVIRKISNGSRSRRGANATAMLLSIIQTMRFQSENILQGLLAILKSESY